MWGVVRYCGDIISLYKSVSTSTKEVIEESCVSSIESFEQMSNHASNSYWHWQKTRTYIQK